MKIFADGELRDMTEEELAVIETEQENVPDIEEIIPIEDRVAAIEDQLAATKIILGVE